MTNTTDTTTETRSVTENIDMHLEAYALEDAARRDTLVAAAWNAEGE